MKQRTLRIRRRGSALARCLVTVLAAMLVASACGDSSSDQGVGTQTNVNDRSQSGNDAESSQRDNPTIASQIALLIPQQAASILESQLADVSYLPAQGVQKPRVLDECSDPSSCIHPQLDEAVYSVPVLSIRFLPDVDGDGVIDQAATNYSGSVNQLRSRIDDLETRNAWWSTEATRFRGYANNDAVPSMGFEIIGEVETTGLPPFGEEAPDDPGVFFPDYELIMTDAGICDWVDNRGVREVWMYTHHHDEIVPAQSQVSSVIGDISNSWRFDELPSCNSSYTVYNFNFTREVDVMLLDRGHQIEALLREHDTGLFVEQFVGGSTPPFSSPARCGNTHWAPGTQDEFVVWETETVTSDCETWTPGGGTQTPVSCSTWFSAAYGDPACFPDGGVAFYVWWMQSLPGHENGLSDGDQALSNWWLPMARLEQVQDTTVWLTE